MCEAQFLRLLLSVVRLAIFSSVLRCLELWVSVTIYFGRLQCRAKETGDSKSVSEFSALSALRNGIEGGISLPSSKSRLTVRRASWDSPLPGFPVKYKVLQLSLLALLSALGWCDFTNSRSARGDVMCRFRRANTQRGDFGIQMFFQGRLYLIL